MGIFQQDGESYRTELLPAWTPNNLAQLKIVRAELCRLGGRPDVLNQLDALLSVVEDLIDNARIKES